jgi:hypothetical protein
MGDGVEVGDCVTMAQFNEFKQSLEERQDRLAQDLQTILDEIRGHCPPNDGASIHGEDGSDGRGGRRGRRNRSAAHGRGRGWNQRNEGTEEIWWEQLLQDREEDGENPIATWAEMKREMRTHFVPKHYRCDLFDKLQNLEQ